MLNEIYKIKDSIDVFVSETESPEKVLVIFHKMTTRDRIEMIAGKPVAEFLALLNGRRTILDVLNELGNVDVNEASKLIQFLLDQRLIIRLAEIGGEDSRYKRQIAYFDDLILERPGQRTQKLLQTKHVTVLGCGGVGGAIAETLARVGVGGIKLFDYKRVLEGNLGRDTYSQVGDLGKPKVEVLKSFLERINHEITVSVVEDMLLPYTDLTQWIPSNTNLVVNTCDEPYIGHTSLKLGRFLQAQGIPLYVAGGFDAHLMSSGELIYPPLTPCIDCAQKTFTNALGEWKPTYISVPDGEAELAREVAFEKNYILGGSGGCAAISAFSAHLASLRIIEFLSEDSAINFDTVRHEYLINSGHVTDFQMKKQDECHVCNIKT